MITFHQDDTYQDVSVNSFGSVSLDLSLNLWSQATSARSLNAFQDMDHFVVKILAEHQQDFSQTFATQGIDKFHGIPFYLRLGTIPTLKDRCAYIERKKVAIYSGGDHAIYLGEVLRVDYIERRPLILSRGKYIRGSEHEVSVSTRISVPFQVSHNRAMGLDCSFVAEYAMAEAL